MRRILLDIETLDPGALPSARLRVTPELTAGNGRVLTRRSMTYVIGELETSDDVPFIEIEPNAVYKFEFERDRGKFDVRRAEVEAGGAIYLSVLIAGYIDGGGAEGGGGIIDGGGA